MIKYYCDCCGMPLKNYIHVTMTGSKEDDPLAIERLDKMLCSKCYESVKKATEIPPRTDNILGDLIADQRYEIERFRDQNKALERRLRHLLQSKFISSFDLVTRRGDYVRNIEEADEIAKKGGEIL